VSVRRSVVSLHVPENEIKPLNAQHANIERGELPCASVRQCPPNGQAARVDRSTELSEPAGIDVIEESADAEAREVRPRPHPLDVRAYHRLLVLRDEEREASRVRPSGFDDLSMYVGLAPGDHPAVRVRDDHRAVDAEQVGREDECAEHIVGDASAGIPQDLRVARPETEHRERLDAGVHAR
jgi:hypothetical protein